MPRVTKRRAREMSRHGLEPRDHDAAVLGNEHRDERQASDSDPRHPYRGEPGSPMRDPNRHQPFGV